MNVCTIMHEHVSAHYYVEAKRDYPLSLIPRDDGIATSWPDYFLVSQALVQSVQLYPHSSLVIIFLTTFHCLLLFIQILLLPVSLLSQGVELTGLW